MGTPDFALFTLRKLVKKHDVIAVYSQPPRPAGRGQKEKPSVTHSFAIENNIPVYTPKSLKSEEEQQKFIDLNADVAVVSAYGLLLPPPILNGTKYGCLNIHPSLLPRWRGAAPIQRQIMAGDKETGVCIMLMDEGMDTGDVIKMHKYHLDSSITAGELHDELGEIGADVLMNVLSDIDNMSSFPQSSEGITYAKKISKEEAKINWNKTAEEIDCIVRGLNPYPATYFEHNNSKIKIYKVGVLDIEHDKLAGTILDDKLTFACGKGAVRILELQKAGKKIMSADVFLKGNKL